MSNERLRSAITGAGFDPETFAERLQVDRKTVERWITTERTPHRAHRLSAAAALGQSDGYLWPSTFADAASKSATEAELIQLYPSRGEFPASEWLDLINGANQQIDILVYAGSFLHDGLPGFAQLITERSNAGVRTRIIIGDPDSEAVARRGEEEGIGSLMAARCQLSLKYLANIDARNLDVRVHATTLYASVFRFDDSVLINPHVYGSPASQSPLFHVKRVPGGRLVAHYIESLEKVWSTAREVP